VLAIGRAPTELVGARVPLAEPGAGHEVRGRLLVGLEVAVEGEEDEDVLLRVRPAARGAVGEETLHELRDEIAPWLIRDESLEQDRVRAPVRVQEEVRAVAVGDDEVGGRRRLGHVAGQAPADGRHLGRRRRVLREDREDPAEGLERKALDTGLAHQRARPGRVRVARERPHGEGVGLERAAHVLPVVGRDVALDLAEVAPCALEGVVGHGEALRLRPGEGVGHVDRDVGPGLVAPPPEAEAAVVVLESPQPVEVAPDRRLDLLGPRQALGLEGDEHVAESRHREHARRELLGALEGIGHEVEDGVGEGLQRRRGGRDLEPAELRHDARRGLHRLDDRALVDLPVRGEGLGGRGSPDRKLHLGRVCRGPGEGADLDPRRARADRRHREAHLGAVVGGHHEAAAGAGGERGVPHPHRDVHRHLAVGLVLHHDRQLEAVAEVEEARR
jgi:hypothetical protein